MYRNPNLIKVLARLAQKLDDFNLSNTAAKVDQLLLTASDEFDDSEKIREAILIWRRQQQEKKNKKQKEPLTMDEQAESADQEMTERHELNLEKQYLLEDLKKSLISKLDERPVEIADRSSSLYFFFKLVFDDHSFITVDIEEKNHRPFVRAVARWRHQTVQLIFPLDRFPNPVGQDFVETVAQTIASKLEQIDVEQGLV